MAINIASIGAKAKLAVPLGRLLQDAGILSRAAEVAASDAGVDDESAMDASTLGLDSAPAPIDGTPLKRNTHKTRFGADEAIPFATRVSAWWNGDILSRKSIPMPSVDVDKSLAVDMSRWGPQRIKLLQHLWGDSFSEPGGAATARKLLAHVMPNSKQSVLDLTAGLGGTAFTLAQDQGLWMDALEPDPDLAAEAAKAAAMAGLGGQVPISHLDLNAINIPSNKYHLAYSRERLFTIEDKLPLIEAAAQSLKPGGCILISDFMVASSDILDTDGYQQWTRSEPAMPQPWSIGLYAKTLEKLGLKIASRQNFSEEYLSDVHTGWQRMISSIKSKDFDRELSDYVLAEGEIWAGRTKALSEGVTSYCRIIARRAG